MSLRIGVLGAAWILSEAIIKPVQLLQTKGVKVTVEAIACRDKTRGEQYAAANNISRVLPSYDALIEDDQIDLVYIPLPNSLHHKWAIAALQKGKHVLCEKPMASNALEAEEIIQAAKEANRFVIEAFHYRFHPVTKRIGEIIRGGQLGTLTHVEADFRVPILKSSDIRYQWDLAGGSLMDTGCYTVNMVRFMADCQTTHKEPQITKATATLFSPKIDKHMEAEFSIERDDESGPLTGKIHCSIRSWIPHFSAYARGTKADLTITNFVAPHYYHKISVFDKQTNTTTSEKLSGMFSSDSTYFYQLEAVVNTILNNDLSYIPFPPEDAIANMQTIDRIYESAGLPKRGTE